MITRLTKRHAFLAATLVSLAVAAPAAAVTYDVNTFTDPLGPGCVGGDCSLRQALSAVNAGAGSGDTIVLQSGTYVLSQGTVLSLAKPAAITGAGANSTVIDANLGSAALAVGAGATGSIVQDVAVTRGQAAGSAGVSNDSAGLTLRRAWIHGNSATLFASGGIINYGTLTITDSTISANTTATVGGGIYSSGTLAISNSTVSGNTADAAPSGWDGGGIYTDGPTQIVNTTITGNSAASGGGISVDNSASVTILNSIISGNIATGVAAPANCKIDVIASVILEESNNDSDGTCNFVAPTDHPNSTTALGPLQDNGGPTPTHALTAGGSAVDGGAASSCPATDQRGIARPQLGACDIGAYELAPPGVSTGSASNVSANGALVAGLVNANLRSTTYRVEYGKTASYGAHTPAVSLSQLAGSQPVVATLSGLSTSTRYHYRVIAFNDDGTAYGLDRTFKSARFAGATLVKRSLKVDARGRVSIRVRCPSGTVGGKCNVIANLFARTGRLPANASAARKSAAKRLGRRVFSVAAGKRRTVKVRLSPAGVAMLLTRTKAKMRLLLTARDGDRHRRTRKYAVAVKR